MEKTKGSIGMIIAGTAAYLFMGFMYVWSVIRLELSTVFPDFTAAQTSLTFTLMMSFFCLGGFCGGKLTERKTPAFSLRCAAALILLGYCGASFMEFLQPERALALMYASFALFVGFGTGIGYNVLLGNISPWFPGRVGVVTGIMFMGFGLSSMLFGFVIEAVCPVIGIFNVLRIFGVLIAAVVFWASFFVKKPPAASKPMAAAGEEGCTPRMMIARPSFWIYFVWNSLSGAAGLLIINNAANIAHYFGIAAGFGMVVSLFNGCGRPFVGMVVDRLDRFRSMFLMIALLFAAALMLIYANASGKYAFMLLGVILVGIIYGGGVTISTKVISDTYGQRHFAVNHSIANFCVIVGSVIGPYLSGVLQDASNGGFASTFYMLLAMSIAELLLIFILMAAVKREEKK